MGRFWRALTRRNVNSDADNAEKSELKRCLGLFDLTALGVGATLGLGAFVLAGAVAHDLAGPAVVLSFLIAAMAAAISGFCYAEFAARVPRAGSAYLYSYVSVGEFVAFTIGWNLCLEYVIGTAGIARGLSGYVDSVCDNALSNFFKSIVTLDVDFLAEYPDFFSCGMILIITCVLSFGVRESSYFNNTFVSIKMLTIILMFITGIIKADPLNWRIPESEVPNGAGVGGFAPFGFAGIMAGAAKCFFGYTGFEGIATTGEEAKNPQRNIPLAIIISLIVIFSTYFGLSTVLTMMAPYYTLHVEAPFPKLYESYGWTELKWVVSVGTTLALFSSLMGALFPLPRILYSMGKDGVIYRVFSKVSKKTQTPVVATVVCGLFAATMSLIFAIQHLIEMMSIGALSAYTIVAISVLVLRYQNLESIASEKRNFYQIEFSKVFGRQILNLEGIKTANACTSQISKLGIITYSILCIILCSCSRYLHSDFYYHPWQLCFIVFLLAGMTLSAVVIARQPIVETSLFFKVPFVPFLPLLSIFLNTYLMCQLGYMTWIRFVIWLAIGYFIYFTYGIRNSDASKTSAAISPKIIKKQEKPREQIEVLETYRQHCTY